MIIKKIKWNSLDINFLLVFDAIKKQNASSSNLEKVKIIRQNSLNGGGKVTADLNNENVGIWR